MLARSSSAAGHIAAASCRALCRDQRGSSAIEYGLITALLAVAGLAAMAGTGGQLKATFNTASATMSGAPATVPVPPPTGAPG